MQERLFSSLNLLLDNIEGTNLLLEYLSEFSKRLHNARDFNSILNILTEELRKIYLQQKVEIILLQNEQKIVKFEFEDDKQKVKPTEGIISQNTLYSYILEKRQTIFTNSYAPFCENINVDTANLPAHSWLGIPMILREKVLGALIIWDDNPDHYFRLQDKHFLSTIADRVCVALENIYLHDYVSESNGPLNFVFNLPVSISKDSPKDVISQLFQLVLNQTGVIYTGLFLKDVPRNKWKLIQESYKNKALSNLGIEFIKLLSGIPKNLFETEHIYFTNNLESPLINKSLLKPFLDFPINSALLLPFKIDRTYPTFWIISFSKEIENINNEIQRFRFIFYIITQLLEKKALIDKTNRYENYIKHLEKIKAAGELASGAVHHLNNILSVILGKTQILKNKQDSASNERDLELIIKAAEDGANSIQKLQKTMSQNEPGIEQEPLAVNELIQEVVEIIRPRYKRDAQNKGIQYQLELNFGNISPIMGESASLREVFLNLINNALDAMPKGGKLSIQTTQKDNKVLIFVSDTGVGIPEKIRSKIFEPFFSTKGENGNGLGLSIAANVIKQHKGRIHVDSILDKGSIFMIELPATQKIITPDTNVNIFPDKMHYKILLVDDEGIVRDTFAEMLEKKGCEVIIASDADEALHKFQEYEYDLIFTDLNMPGINGLDLATQLKKHNPKIPVFIITGWNDSNNSTIEINGIIDGIIRKPFNMDKVIQEIHKVIRHEIK